MHDFLERWNDSHLRLHPKTQFHMLRSLRIQQPFSVDYGHVVACCRDEFASNDLRDDDMTQIYNEVKGRRVLGVMHYELKVRLRCDSSYFCVPPRFFHFFYIFVGCDKMICLVVAQKRIQIIIITLNCYLISF